MTGASYLVRNQLFINGEWRNAHSGETFDVINPGTGELITKVASAGKQDIDDAVKAASDAAEAWEAFPPPGKASLMNKFADKIEQHVDELATLESEDNGKMYQDVVNDCMFCATLVRYYGGLAMQNTGKSMMRDNMGPY